MKYLCMIFYDEKKLYALSKVEADALIAESLAYDDVLRKGGHLIAAQALQPVRDASTIRSQAGKLTITDGPFAETNEQLGGFILIDARDFEEAAQLASKIPVIRLGGVEVRPIKELTLPSTLGV